ncbi:flagellin [Pseudoalteromonas carrageenovora]|nr:flagellin [Pseudoalteromonas carrageenovora]
MSLGDVSADALGGTQRADVSGTYLAADITAILAENAGTGNAGTLTFTHTEVGGTPRDIEIDLSNVTDAGSFASALNAAVGPLGVIATSNGTDVALTGDVLLGETLTAAAFDGANPPVAIAAPTTPVSAATAVNADGTLHAEDIDISTAVGSGNALAIIDNALGEINESRASLGAVQNRFEHTISNLANIEENVSASRSRIQDTDFATETAEMTKNQILQQAGTSILSQANQIPQAAISLLGG